MYVRINIKKLQTWKHKKSTLNKTRNPRFMFINNLDEVHQMTTQIEGTKKFDDVNRNNVNQGDANQKITVKKFR